jgi:hypothetical protein
MFRSFGQSWSRAIRLPAVTPARRRLPGWRPSRFLTFSIGATRMKHICTVIASALLRPGVRRLYAICRLRIMRRFSSAAPRPTSMKYSRKRASSRPRPSGIGATGISRRPRHAPTLRRAGNGRTSRPDPAAADPSVATTGTRVTVVCSVYLLSAPDAESMAQPYAATEDDAAEGCSRCV